MSTERTRKMVPPRIVRNGKRATSYIVKAKRTSGADSEKIYKGMFLKKTTDGKVEPVVDYDGNTAINNAADVRYMALEDWDASAERFIMVQEIDEDTVLEIQADHATEGSAIAKQDIIGKTLQLDTDDDGVAVAALASTDNQAVEVVDTEDNYSPFHDRNSEAYNFLYVRFLQTALDK